MEHLEQESGDATDQHGRQIGMDLPGDRAGFEVGTVRVVTGRTGLAADPQRPTDLGSNVGLDQPEAVRRDQLAPGAHLVDGRQPVHGGDPTGAATGSGLRTEPDAPRRAPPPTRPGLRSWRKSWPKGEPEELGHGGGPGQRARPVPADPVSERRCGWMPSRDHGDLRCCSGPPWTPRTGTSWDEK